jgi:parafibromin
MTGVREIGMGFVSIIERKVVVDWLIGKSGLEGPKGRIIPLEEDSHEKEKDETMDAKESVEEGQVLDTVIEKEREVPVAKRAKYFIDKEDQDRVRQILRVVDGPSYATQGPDNRPIKDAVGYKTRATILRGERLNVSLIRPQGFSSLWLIGYCSQNFESARVIAKPRLDILKEQARLKGQDGAPAAGVAISSGGAVKPGKKKQLTPIILISPSSSALITMHNVKRFLEESMCVFNQLVMEYCRT